MRSGGEGVFRAAERGRCAGVRAGRAADESEDGNRGDDEPAGMAAFFRAARGGNNGTAASADGAGCETAAGGDAAVFAGDLWDL